MQFLFNFAVLSEFEVLNAYGTAKFEVARIAIQSRLIRSLMYADKDPVLGPSSL